MTCTIIQHIPIDSEWAETLVGLRLNISNNWWLDIKNGGLNRGHIAVINLNLSSWYYFEVELDNEPGAHYPMCYASALLYANKNHPCFSQYCLLLHCPGNPDNKIAWCE